jgi:hypothetical protein
LLKPLTENWRYIMKKSLIAFLALSALSSVAFATDGANGESKYSANTFAPTTSVISAISTAQVDVGSSFAVTVNSGSNGESKYGSAEIATRTDFVSAISAAAAADLLQQNDDERRLDEKSGSRG